MTAIHPSPTWLPNPESPRPVRTDLATFPAVGPVLAAAVRSNA